MADAVALTRRLQPARQCQAGGAYGGAGRRPERAAIQNDTVPEAASTEITLPEAYDRAWLRVGIALDRSNFTVDDRDRAKGVISCYVDPKDMSSGNRASGARSSTAEGVAKQYESMSARSRKDKPVSIIDDKARSIRPSATDHGAACRSNG